MPLGTGRQAVVEPTVNDVLTTPPGLASGAYTLRAPRLPPEGLSSGEQRRALQAGAGERSGPPLCPEGRYL